MKNLHLFRTVTMRENYSINAETPAAAIEAALSEQTTPVCQVLDSDDFTVVDRLTGKDVTPPLEPIDYPARTIFVVIGKSDEIGDDTILTFYSRAAADAAAQQMSYTLDFEIREVPLF